MRISLAVAAILVGLLNFFAFMCGALKLGGDAVNGKIVADHYFVANHGHYAEVSRAAYMYSLWHVYSLILTFPMTMGGMGYLVLKMKDLVAQSGRAKL